LIWQDSKVFLVPSQEDPSELYFWVEHILPNWETRRENKNFQKHWRTSGIPSNIRGMVWERSIGNELDLTVEDYKQDLEEAVTGKYGDVKVIDSEGNLDLTNDFWSLNIEINEFHEPMHNNIKMDLQRTFTKLIDRSSRFRTDLFPVILAYSHHYQGLGYVQGMSYLAGVMLMYMDGFKAYCCLANLLKNHFFESFFRLDLPEMGWHLKFYEQIFSSNLPKLYEHFLKIGLMADHYCLNWFLTLYSKSLPLKLCSKIWDCFMMEGEPIIYCVAVAILHLYEGQLRKSTFEECVAILKALPDGVDENELFETMEEIEVPFYIFNFLSRIPKAHISIDK